MTRSRIRPYLLAAVATFALAPLPCAQEPHDDIDQVILKHMEQGHIPGVAVAIIKGDQVVWTKGYGTANFELGTTVSLDTPFFLASISKTATATALMQLRDDGLLALDDDINADLDFHIINPLTQIAGATYRQLLTHTSGLKDNWTVMNPLYQPGDSIWQLEDFHPEYWVSGGQFYYAGQNFYNWAPGSYYSYCNQGFSLLGLLGQNVSGRPFDDLCAVRVFQPLGMTHTSFRLEDFDPDTLAMPYTWDWPTLSYVAEGHYGYPDWPAGTLRSSILDLSRFLRAYINEGTTEGVELLSSTTVAEMLTVQFPAPDPQGLCFYYITSPASGEVVGHDGGDPGVLTDMYFRPSDDTGVILLANGDSGFDSYWSIYQRLWNEAEVVSDDWHYVGQGLDGSVGQPYLEAKGDLIAGRAYELLLQRALPGAPAWMAFGPSAANAHFKGGTLVPDLAAPGSGVLALVTDALGEVDLGGRWPAGIPSGTVLHLQAWIQDPSGPSGFAASNAVRATTP